MAQLRRLNSSTSRGNAKLLSCWISTNSQDSGCRRLSTTLAPVAGTAASEGVVMALGLGHQGITQGHRIGIVEPRLPQCMQARAGKVGQSQKKKK